VSDDFDVFALHAALDAARLVRELSWRAVTNEIWELSSELNARREDHPLSPSTLTGLAVRRNVSCQHALFVLRWLDRTPESFVPSLAGGPLDQPLPAAGPDRRPRWDLRALYGALDERRRARSLTWPQLADELACTPNQLTALRTAKFATGMRLAMRITPWLEQPAANFVRAAKW
jgi:hypothetical protein